MRRSRQAVWLALALMASWKATAAPQLDTGAFYDYLAPGRMTFTKRIQNLGDATAFVKVEAARISYGTDGEPSEHAMDGSDRPLIVSPSQLIIPAGGSRDIRLVYRGPRTAEQYFRLRFVPVVPQREDAFGLAPEAREQYRQAIVAGVGLLKAIGTVVLVQPVPAYFNTHVEQKAGALQVHNNGNTTVLLEDFSTCTTRGKCAQGRTVHVRPGQHFALAQGKGAGFRFILVEGKDRHRYTP